MGKIIISKIYNRDYLFLFNDDHEVELIKYINNESIVDNIYKGRICEINQGLNSCFVAFDKDKKAFLSLDEFKNREYKCGDEILIQIKTDALKTKLPQASLDLCIPGKYVVCHVYGSGYSISKKLSVEEKKKLALMFENLNVDGAQDYKWVLRTNSASLIENEDISLLKNEVEKFIKIASFLKNEASYRSLYSVLYNRMSDVINIISDISIEAYDSVVTDDENMYSSIVEASFPDKTVKLYEDEYISLKNLHSLETYLLRAVDKKVYLDCGGYLIIEPTEAMTVIDVNSGKAEGRRKDSASYIFKVNQQAAVEIAKQLRIRNISGIIMVDFINMEKETDNERLLAVLSEELKKDNVKTNLIDMTPLGIVEITRKKIDISLDKSFSR